eukprot:maker-scaffold_2-snap-gene-26.1-mRNA-1 protein AED:0.23 eAED:0.23 QI:28/0.5/0.33/1/0/0/3/0/186
MAESSNQMSGERKNMHESAEAFPSFYSFKLNNLEETEEIDFKRYKNKVCLLINQLVSAYDKFRAQGLEILAFPCNQFASEEPGTKEEIREFVNKYGVKFQMFKKIDVNGENSDPIWGWLKKEKQGPLDHGEIEWNFTKFLVDGKGKVRYRFEPKESVASMEPKILELLKELLLNSNAISSNQATAG